MGLYEGVGAVFGVVGCYVPVWGIFAGFRLLCEAILGLRAP